MLIVRTKCLNMIKVITMTKSYDEFVKINNNPNLSGIPDHPYRILTIGGSGSGKTMCH